MQLTSWLEAFRNPYRRPASQKATQRRRLARKSLRARAAVCTLLVTETLEDRTLLSSGGLNPATTTLQQGVNGYAGATDAFIGSKFGNTNNSAITTLTVASTLSVSDSLLRWDLSSTGISAASIQSATISVNVISGTNLTVNLYALDRAWDPSTVTWFQANATQAWQAGGATGATDSGTTVLGSVTVNGAGPAAITLNAAGLALLQSWINNPASNFGFIARLSGTGAVAFDSSRSATVANRPTLTIAQLQPGLSVDAGQNEAVAVTSVLQLSGSVENSDSGASQPLTTMWSMASGPGTVTFQNATSPTSDVIFSAVGTYVLQLSASNGDLSSSSQITISVQPPPNDVPPIVNAGANQTSTLGQPITLAGVVTDPLQYPVSNQWSQLSGPGTVTFASPTSTTTTAQFSAPGTYVLDLVATDGALAGNSTVTVTVNAPATLLPPVASAGANQTVNFGTAVNLNGTVTDSNTPGVILTTAWQVANGPGAVTFGNSASTQTTATFSAAGTYYLRLLATYGGLTDQSYVTITVNPGAQQSQSTVNLQQGLNGYSGAADTYLSVISDTSNFATSTTLTVNSLAKKETDALLSWNLASAGVSGTVQSATIAVYVTSTAGAPYNLYALSRPWNVNQANFDMATSTQAWQVAGANGAQDYNSTILGTLQSSTTGFATITLNAAGIAVLQSWINNPSSNYGFIIKGAGTGGLIIDSSDIGTVADRPTLTIALQASSGGGGGGGTTTITDPVAAATAAVNGTSGTPSTGYMNAVGLNLSTLYFQYLMYQQNGSQGTFAPNLTQANVDASDVSGTKVSVFVTTEPTLVNQVSTALQALGMTVTVVSGNSISGWLPIGQIANAAVLHGLVTATPSLVASSNAIVVATVPAPSPGAQPTATAPFDPAQIRVAYGLDKLNGNGAGITIAIVDAFNNPNIISDANAFSAMFGLPMFNQSGGPTFTVLNQTGGTPLPANDTSGTWNVEEALDVEWAHTIAPNANIILFEANSDSGSDLFQAELTAASFANVSVISNSWGGPDIAGEQQLDPIFTTPAGHQGVTFLASTGDDGPPSGYPSTSPNVISVGGTMLVLQANGTYVSESVWNETAIGDGEGAGGVSTVEAQPGYQIGNVNGTNSTNRVTPDVSMEADPVSGVFVIDSFATGSTTSALQIGGTSLSSPMWAGLIAIADQLRSNAGLGTLDGPSQTLPRLYNLPSTDFHDITTGSNGFPATPGYDLATGRGTPIANLLVPDLAGVTTPTQQGPSVTLFDTGNPFGEKGGTSTITAVLSQASLVPVTVNIQFSSTANANGFSAAQGSQYNLSSSQIVIAPGQTAGSITLTGVDDGINTGDESILATLVTVTNGKIAGNSQQLTIVRTEADLPEVSLAITGGTGVNGNILTENGSTVQVVATLTHTSAVPITITVGFSGDAVFGINYSPTGAALPPSAPKTATITIAAGATSGSITLTGLTNPNSGAPTAPAYVTILSITPAGAAVAVPTGQTATVLVVDPVGAGGGLPIGGNSVVSLSIAGSPADENGGQMVVTITQTHPTFNAMSAQLLFSGTAELGTNYRVTDANGNPLQSGDAVFIDSPNFSTFITITAINDGLLPPPSVFTVIVSLGIIHNGSASVSAGSVTGTINNVNTSPSFALSLSSPAFTEAGGTEVVTATLGNGITAQTFDQPVTVNLSLTGTAIANLDYTASSLQIVIPPGQTSGFVTLTGLSDAFFEGEESINVGIASLVNASGLSSSQTVTAYLVDQQVPIEFLAEGTTVPQGSIAQVNVVLPRALPFAVSVHYATTGGIASSYVSQSGTLTFAPGQTTRTIDVQTNDNFTSDPTQNFSVVLLNPTIVGAPAAAVASGVGLSVSAPATVTMLDSIQVAENVTGGTSASGLPSPPDIAGAAGDGFVVLMLNGQYSVYNSAGQLESISTLAQFWANAGASLQGTPTVPRLLFTGNRWVAVALDHTFTNNVEQPNNNILLAVSLSGDPTAGWKSVTIPSDPTNTMSFATSIALGFDSFGVQITTDMSNGKETLTNIPDVSVFVAPPGAPGTGSMVQFADFSNSTSVQPTVSLDGFNLLATLFEIDGFVSNSLGEFNVLNAGANAAPLATLSGPVPITSPVGLTSALGAALPPAGQPGTSSTIGTGTNAFTSNAVEVNGNVWLVQTVSDPNTGHTDLQWLELSGPTIVQSGLISDPRLSFYDPSIAVDANGDVVIGFTGSAANTTAQPGDFASAYAVMGTTTSGVTTFTAPALLSHGTGLFQPVFGNAPSAWANYSSTVVDGSSANSSTFWTFQEVATGPNQWSVEMFKIQFGLSNPVTVPGVTLTSSSGSFDANGGTATVTATLASVQSNPVIIDLAFTGTAVANLDYSITNGVNSVLATNSPIEIIIPAGQLTGSVVLTGLNNTAAGSGQTVDVAITSVNGTVPSPPQQVELSIVDQNLPQISIEDLTVDESNTSTALVVVHLSASAGPVTLNYTTAADVAHPGTNPATAGTDYTPVSGTISFADGQTTQTISIPILGDPAVDGAETFLVDISGASRGSILRSAATVTLLEENPQIAIEDQNTVGTSPTTVQLTVQLAQAATVPVTVHFQTVDGTAKAGVDYTTNSGTVTFAPGVTTQMIGVAILGNPAQTSSDTFFVQLSNPSLGTLERDEATVTLFNVTPGSSLPDEFDTASGETDFTADTSASGPFAPANPSGAVGPTDLVVFDSDTYQAFNKSTSTLLQSSTLNQFWTNADLNIASSDYVGQPHVVFDPATNRWYASALDESVPPGSVGPAVVPDNILLAVSKTSDPTQGWVGFKFATDPSNVGVRADFDLLGFNGDSVVVTANMYTIATGALAANAVLSVPKADLTGASPTVARATLLTTLSTTTANTFDPAVDYDATGNEALLAQATTGNDLVVELVSGGAGPTAAVNDTSPTLIPITAFNPPIAAPQPAGAPPLSTGPMVQTVGEDPGTQLDALSNSFSGSIVQVNGVLWAAQTVETNGQDAIEWYEINVSGATPTLLHQGTISDPNLYFYYPSLSVDSVGDVVIGFSGSSLTQDISSYAVYGTTTGGVTTFTNPILLKQGTGIFAGFSNANVLSASITASSSTFNSTGSGDTDTITVQLGVPAASNTIVKLGFSGTALANRDYSISAGTNAVVNAVGAPIELLIPEGQTSGTVVLTGLNNPLATGDETLNVSVTSINGAPPTATTSTSLTLVDTTKPMISAENLGATETAATGTSTAQVLVRLSESVSTAVTVDYSTQDGTALAGTDYTAIPAGSGSVTFAPGQTVAAINVTLLNNAAAEGKSFSLLFTLPAGGRGTMATTSATVTLLNPGSTSFPSTSVPAVTLTGGGTFAEDSGSVTVTATLSGGAVATDTLINLSFGGNGVLTTATFGSAYVASSESIFIPAGSTSGSITLTGNDVLIGANNESVQVGIKSGATLSGSPAQATLTPGNVAGASIRGQVTGNSGGLAGIIVYFTSLPVSEFGTEGDFNPSVNMFTTTDANGNYSFTGLAAGNYIVRELIPSNELVTSPSGDVSSFALAKDQQLTGVNFTNTLTAVWGAYSATAIDPSNPGVFWTFQAFDADQSGSDFNTWGVQATQLAVTNFTSDTGFVNDSSDPGLEQFDIPVTLTATSNLVTSSGEVTVIATIPAQSTPTTIYLGFSSGLGNSAEGNVNYKVIPGFNSSFAEGAPVEIIIPAGGTFGTVFLEGLNDFASAAPTSLSVSVTQVNLAPDTGTTNTLNLTVGTPTVSIENAVGVETGTGSTPTVTVPVRLSSALTGANVTVDYEILPVTATEGASGAFLYPTGSPTGSITISAGSTEGFVDIPLTGNAIPQAETFQVLITSASVGGIPLTNIVNSPATVTLFSTEPPSTQPIVTLSSTGTFTENSGSVTVTATLSQPTTVPTLINLSFTGTATLGTATSAGTYSVSGESIVIPAGSMMGSITLTGNDVAIAGSETVVVGFSAASVFGAVPGTPNQVTASLGPGTVASASISGVVSNISTGAPLPGVLVFIDKNGNGIFEPSAAGSLVADPFTTTSATGAYSFPYLAAGSYTVIEVVPQGYVNPIPPVPQPLTQGEQLTGVDFTDSPSTVTVSSFTSASPTNSFNSYGPGDTDAITATLSAAAGTGGVTLVLGFTGTAVANTDYSVGPNGANSYAVTNVPDSPIEIVIPQGQTTGSVLLTGLGNKLATGDETLNVYIYAINGNPPAGSIDKTLTLVDTTPTTAAPGGPPIITAENAAVVESLLASTAQVVVRLSQAVTTPVTVDYQTADGTATALSGDYTAAMSSITFLPGQPLYQNISIPISNLAADGSYFDVNLSLPSGGRGTLATAQASVTFLTTLPPANSVPNVTLNLSYTSATGNSFAEDSGTATVTAMLAAPSSTDTLIYLLFGGSAAFPTDYSTSSESIFIPAGSLSGKITLTGNDVAIGANPLSVVVGIQSVYGASVGSPSSVTASLTPGNVASASFSGNVGYGSGSSGSPFTGALVFVDENGNGIFEPSAAPGILADPFTITGSGGSYSFTGLAAGSYTVSELPPQSGLQNYPVTSPANDAITVPLSQAGSVGGISFFDTTMPISVSLSPVTGSFNAAGLPDTSAIYAVLNQPAGTGGVTLVLGFSGTAVANTDYSVGPNGANSYAVTNVPGAPIEIVIPQGQIQGSILLTGMPNPNALTDESVTVSVVSINGVPPATPPPPVNLTLLEPSFPLISVEDLAVVDNAGSATAQVVVRLNEPVTAQSQPLMVTYSVGGGTASTNDYTPVSSGTIAINPGQTEVFIPVLLTGTVASDGETFFVDLSSPSRGMLGAHSNATVTLFNALPPTSLPTVTLAASAATLTETGTATVTATLSAVSDIDTVVNLTFTPEGAVIGEQYVVTGEKIVIPAGLKTGSITITGIDNGPGSFVINAVSAAGATLPGTTTFTETLTVPANLQGSPVIRGEVEDQNGEPMAGVYVYLGQFLATNVFEPNDAAYIPGSPFVVTGANGEFEFTGLSSANPPGNNYSVSELVPGGYVAMFPWGNYYDVNIAFSTTTGLTYTTNFLSGDSVSTTSSSNIVLFRNEPAGPADPTGAVGPSDIIQADNNNFVIYNKISGTVEESMSLNQFWLAAWNEEAFGGGVDGADVLMNAYEPQVVYDSASGRWYVSALDNSNPPYTPFSGTTPRFAANDILLAVSKDSNPLDGWVEFVIPADEDLYGLNPDPLGLNPNVPDHRPLRADADTLGFNSALNSTALVLTANLYDDGSGETSIANDGSDATSGDLVSTMILSIPKEDLLSAQGTNDPVVMNNLTSVSEGAWTYGINPQAVVNYDADGASLVLAQAANQTTGALDPSALELTTILASGTSYGISGTSISIPIPVTLPAPIPAPQPNNAPPVAVTTETVTGANENSALQPGLVHDGIDQRLSNVVEINGDLWTTQTVFDPLTNTDAIAWYEISLKTDTIIQGNLISDPNLFFYFPSIAVNAAGDVVIGFNGSDSTQFISSYVAVGTTFAGVTTFNSAQLVKSGTGVYVGRDSGIEPGPIGPIATPPSPPTASSGDPPPAVQRGGLNLALWGAYSATVVDPSNPNAFWTFQSITDSQFSSDTESWGIQATRIAIDQPTITLSVSGPPSVATPQKLGVLGDSLSTNDVPGTTPGWVSQLTTSGDFAVPVGGNQAVDGAVAAGLTAQLPGIQVLAGSNRLNYTVIIIGGNDAVALAEGTETAAAYINTIETNIENTLTALQGISPSDHLILGTVPDIFVTPLVQGLGLSAATILADRVVIQQANAAITEFALSHGIAVIDLFASTDALLTGPLTLGGVTFTTAQLFAPDGFHPSAIVQGLIANMVIDAADAGYGAGLTPLTDQQLVTNVGLTPTATDATYLNLAQYVLARPVPPITSQTITATLSAVSSHDVLVQLSFGGSVLGQDYFATSQSIVIPAGQASGSITLTGLGKPSAIVVVGFSDVGGAVTQTAQPVTATLTTVPSIVTLGLSSSNFSEAGGTTTVTASLFAPSNFDTVIDLSFGGTATLGQDYQTSGETIVIPKGQLSGSITLTGNNTLITGNETVVVGLMSQTGAYAQLPEQVTATLTPAVATTGTVHGTVSDNASNGLPNIIVYIGTGAFDPTTDPFTTTAADGSYSISGLAPGTYTVRELVPANLIETLPVGDAQVVTLSSGSQVTVNFINTPLPSSILLSVSPTTFNESGGTATVTASLASIQSSNVVITLKFTGTANQNSDFFSGSQTIVIPAGQISGNVVLTGIPVNFDGSPTVKVNIVSVMDAQLPNAANSSVTATLLQNGPVASGLLSGTVYKDLNFDGVLQSGEPGLPNVITYLDKNGNGIFQLAAATGLFADPFTFSNANGNYSFAGLDAATGPFNIFQIVPTPFGQTEPSTPSGGHLNVNTNASGLNFGDAFLSNPSVSLNVSAPTISASGGTSTLTATLSQTTPVPVSIVVKVGGLATFGDYHLVGPGGTVALSTNNPTFTITIPGGQLSVNYTITAIGDSNGTVETITFDVVSVTNGHFGAGTEAETAILPSTSGSPQLVVDSPSQISGTQGVNPALPFNTTPTTTFTTGNTPNWIISADLNGDGRADLVEVNKSAGTITVILNPTSASPNVTTYNAGPTPTSVVAADFNGDGNLDLAVTVSTGVLILKNDATGHFTVVGSSAAGTSPSAVIAGDFNGDGKMDLAVANSVSNNVSILFGNGNFSFQSAVNIATGPTPTDIKAADLNGDGKLDLVVANSGLGPNTQNGVSIDGNPPANGVNVVNTVAVLINNGNGTFTPKYFHAGIQPRSIAIADFNDDGHLDIAVANVGFNPNQTGNINTVSILYGNGAGSFTPVAMPVTNQPLPAGTFAAGTSVFTITAGDLNGDGLPDIVVTNNALNDNTLTVLINNGPAGSGGVSFLAPQALSLGAGRMPVSVVTADFNGTGTLSIASANDFGSGGMNGVSIFQNLDTPNQLVFHVYLNHPSASTVVVHYATQNGTGRAYVDYVPVTGTLIFAPGQVEETVFVPILPGAHPNQTVLLQLSSSSNASIQIGTGVGTINPFAPTPLLATAALNSGNLTITDPNQNDAIQLIQLSPGWLEVLVNGVDLGVFNTTANSATVSTPNGHDAIYFDEDLTAALTLIDPTSTDAAFSSLPFTIET